MSLIFFLDEILTFPARANRENFMMLPMALNKSEAGNFCDFKEFSFWVHKPNEMPTIFHKAYSLEYYRMKRFLITAVSFQHDASLRTYKPHQRDCYFEGERELKFFKSYTKSNCDWECLTNYTLAFCDCVKFSMPRNQTTRVCGWKDANCYFEAMEQWPKYMILNEGQKPCDCLDPCVDIKYSLSTHREAPLTRQYSNTLTTFGHLSFQDHSAEVRENIATYKLENCKVFAFKTSQIILLKIKFSVIAEVGGLLGLFMGCSLLSIIEIFYFITTIILKLLKGCKLSTQIETNDENVLLKIEDLKNSIGELKKFNDELKREMMRNLNEINRQNAGILKRMEKLEI